MSLDDQAEFERLAKAERVIKALETLVEECEGKGLDPFVARIKSCIKQCQNDYVALHRALYRKSAGTPAKPSSTKH